MNYLILSQIQPIYENTEQDIYDLDQDILPVVSDFDEKEINKLLKKSDDYAFVIIQNYPDFPLSFAAIIASYFVTKNIPVFSNVSDLENVGIISKKYFYYDDKNALKALLKKNLKKIKKDYIQNTNINVLLKKGIPFTSDCFSLYISKDKPEICKLFIDGGIDINSKDDSGTPMINQAVRKDNLTLVKQFIEMEADINCISEDRGYTPVMDAVWRGNLEITDLLIKNKAELNTINKEGQSNLVLAVGANRVEITKLLVENGADPDIKDSMGMSAYGYASLFKKQEILDILKPYHKE